MQTPQAYESAIASCVRVIRNPAPGMEADVFKTQAKEAAFIGRKAGLAVSDVSEKLWLAADETGLVDEHGADIVQGWLAEAMRTTPDVKVPASADGFSFNDPDLSILDDRRGDLPEFPVGVLSEAWRDWLERSAHGAGVTPGHVATPLLSIAAGLIGTSRRVQASRSWSEPCTLWAAIVGFSGTGKTPGIDVTKRALSQIQKELATPISELERQHATKVEAAKAAQKKWKTEVAAATEGGLPIPPMPETAVDLSAFVVPRLYVSDATVERIAVMLQARPQGTLCIVDELAGLFLNMGRYSGGSDREFWLEAWNGKHFLVERMGRPAVSVDHLLVGITGGLQPDKLSKSFGGDSDGMYARVLFGWPKEPTYRPLTNDVAEMEPDTINAFMRLAMLTPVGGSDFIPTYVPLSDDAVKDFEHFRHFLHDAKAGLDSREREWWSKGEAQVLRIAGTLTFLEWARSNNPEPKTIRGEAITGAISLWRDYYWPHARAALRQIGLSERNVLARRTLKWIRANFHKLEGGLLSARDIRREALGQSLDQAQTEELFAGLEKSGWLRRLPPQPTGGRARQRWQINPALLGHAESAGSAERGVR
jgi:hypothetical protein